MEEKFNKLIVLLQAYMNACKDFHYFCKSYALHLLADEVNSDDFYDLIDEIKAEKQDNLIGIKTNEEIIDNIKKII